MDRSDIDQISREALLRETAARGNVEQRSLERRDRTKGGEASDQEMIGSEQT